MGRDIATNIINLLVGDLSRFGLFRLDPLLILIPKIFRIIRISKVWPLPYLLMVITETRRGHSIRYLRFINTYCCWNKSL